MADINDGLEYIIDDYRIEESLLLLKKDGLKDIEKSISNLIEEANYYRFNHTTYNGITRELLLSKNSGYIISEEEKLKWSYIGYLEKYVIYEEKESVEKIYSEDETFIEETEVNEFNDIFKINSIDHKLFAKLNVEDFECYINNSANNFIIIAPPAQGKTSSCIAALKNSNFKFIFIVPLRVLAIQISEKYDIDLYLYDYNSDLDELTKNSDAIVSTYDSFRQIHHKIKEPWKYILVIDEYHKLVSDCGFRIEILRFLSQIMRDYRKVVGLTGTPYGCIDQNLCISTNTKIIRYIPEDDYKIHKVANYKICTVFDGEARFNTFIHHLSSHLARDGITVVFINNKKQLEKIWKYFIKEQILADDQIRPLTADDKYSPEFEDLTQTMEFNPDVKLVLSTSVLSSGININNDNFKNFYVLDQENLIELIQFIYRFRKGVDNVYDFISNTHGSLSIFNLETKIVKEIKSSNDLAMSLNNLNRDLSTLIKDQDNNNIENNGYVYLSKNKAVVDRNKIRYDYLNKIHKLTLEAFSQRKNYLEYCGFRGIIKTCIFDYDIREQFEGIEYYVIPDFDVDKILDPGKTKEEEYKPQIIEDIFSNFSSLISFYIKKYHPDIPAYSRILREIKSLDETEYERLKSQYSYLWLHNISKIIIDSSIALYNIGFSLEIIKKLVENSDSDLIIQSFNLLQYFPYLKIAGDLIKYLPYQEERENVEFLLKLERFLNENNRKIDNNSFKSYAKQIVPAGKTLNKYFSSGVISKFRYIYSCPIIGRQVINGDEKNIYKITNLSVVQILEECLSHSDDLELSESDIHVLYDFIYRKYKNALNILHHRKYIGTNLYHDLLTQHFIVIN